MRIAFALIMQFWVMMASSQTNYSGIWKLKNLEYLKGPHYTNALPEKFFVSLKPDSIIIDKTGLPINGRSITLVGDGRKLVKSVSWSADKKIAIFTTVYYAVGNINEVELTRVDAWELSLDTKQLFIYRRSIETKVESWETKAVYYRQ